MTKKIFIGSIILVLVCFTLPMSMPAQTPMNSFFCCETHNPCLHFTSQSDLDYHNCRSHGIGCRTTPDTKKSSVFKSPVGGCIAGAALGGLVGSVMKNDKGKNQAGLGAGVGAGAGLLIGIAFSPKKHMGDDISHTRRPKFFSNVAIVMPGDRIGIIVKL